jgi:hypothetical protein
MVRLAPLASGLVYWWRMDTERTIDEIEWLEQIFAVPDTRPLSQSDLAATNRRHDDKLAHSPWFRLWQSYGVCCRPEPLELRLGEMDSTSYSSASAKATDFQSWDGCASNCETTGV